MQNSSKADSGMGIDYQVFEKERFLIQRFTGEFNFPVYIKYMKHIMEHPFIAHIEKVLIDFREIKFDLSLKSFEEAVTKMKKIREEIIHNKIKNEKTKVGFWVNTPDATAIAQLFKFRFTDMNYDYCSTEECVKKSLNITSEFGNLDEIVTNLKQTF